MMIRTLIAMSFLSFLFGCREKDSASPLPPDTVPTAASQVNDVSLRFARGTILVENGSPELVLDTIKTHTELFGKEAPRQFRVTIAKGSNGSIIVQFPDGAPPYDIVNLINWLDAPPDIARVSGAKGWITSPSTGIRYSLKPDVTNEWGDTLIGAASDGTSVRVYLPEASMCELSQAVIAEPEPDSNVESTSSPLTVTVVMDASTDFGNPQFRTTHPKDTSWGP